MAREVKSSGRTIYLPDREEWEEVPTLWRCPSCGVETTCREIAEKLGHSRPPHKIGLCVTKMEPVKPEEPRAGPYALGFERLRCSGCGVHRDRSPGPDHWAPAPGGWERCGEWR